MAKQKYTEGETLEAMLEVDRLRAEIITLTGEREDLKIRIDELERGPVVIPNEESERKARVREHQSKLRGGIS